MVFIRIENKTNMNFSLCKAFLLSIFSTNEGVISYCIFVLSTALADTRTEIKKNKP